VENFRPLPWEVEVAESAEYKVSIFAMDKPAGKAIERDFAYLEVDGERHQIELAPGNTGADFLVQLTKGESLLKGWFSNNDGDLLAAFYMYIERI